MVVEKVSRQIIFLRSEQRCQEISSVTEVPQSGRVQHHTWTLTEEADQSLKVLRSCRQEELLAHELQSA